MKMTNSPNRQRAFPPDARIIRPQDQPQRYDLSQTEDVVRPLAPVKKSGDLSAFGQGVREVVETILPAVLIALMIHLFLAQATRVEGYSMEPTLYGHQRLVIEKLSFRLRPPERGEIVVLRVPNYGRDMLIKRVIGLPGEAIEVIDGQVYINDKPLDEPYVNQSPRGSYPRTIVPEDSVFVMGDNRNNSNDSRSFGPVPYEDIVGHAWIRYWPLDDVGVMP